MASKSWAERLEIICFGDEMHEMMLRDRELKKERERDRKTTQNTPTEIINHFSHSHPLTYSEPDYPTFNCNSCARRGQGKRYHCAKCEFDMHVVCAQSDITWLVHHMTEDEMDSDSVDQESVVNSFAHPAHKLVAKYKKQSFKCAHCNNFGDGLRLTCNVCGNDDDVGYHEVCGRNPTRLTSYLHPKHELELKLRKLSLVKCDLCGVGGSTNKRMYGCKECGFYLHPSCTQWPLYLAHQLHPPHPLVLKPCSIYSDDTCSACREIMISAYNSYKYSCKLCDLDFDLRCILQHSKLGTMGEDVKRKYDGQRINVLPVTNLSLPVVSKNRDSGLRTFGMHDYGHSYGPIGMASSASTNFI